MAWNDDECKCPLRPNMTVQELMDEIFTPDKNCCSSKNNPAKGWICPTLDKEHIRARQEERYIKHYTKKNGEAPSRRKRRKNLKLQKATVNLENLKV